MSTYDASVPHSTPRHTCGCRRHPNKEGTYCFPARWRLCCTSRGALLRFPTPALGSAERPELLAPAQIGLSRTGFLTQSLITRPQAAALPVPGSLVCGESWLLCFFQLESCSGQWGWGEQREPAWSPPISGGIFGELGRSGACPSGSAVCRGSVREANPAKTKQLLDVLLFPRGQCLCRAHVASHMPRDLGHFWSS